MEEFVSQNSTPRYVVITISSKPGAVRNMGTSQRSAKTMKKHRKIVLCVSFVSLVRRF